MFKLMSNALCNTVCLVTGKMTGMHEQMKRLYEAAEAFLGIKTQAELARVLNASSQTINNWEARGISKAGMLKVQQVIGCSATWLDTGNGDMLLGEPEEVLREIMVHSAVNDRRARAVARARALAVRGSEEGDPFVAIRKVKLQLSAGVTGFSTEPEDFEGDTIIVPSAWLKRKGYSPERLIALTVKGESMETTFHEGDVVVVNVDDTKPVDGSVYAVNYEGEAVIKRLSRDAGSWWLTSDNPDQRKFHRKVCQGEACIVLGRVVRSESERF